MTSKKPLKPLRFWSKSPVVAWYGHITLTKDDVSRLLLLRNVIMATNVDGVSEPVNHLEIADWRHATWNDASSGWRQTPFRIPEKKRRPYLHASVQCGRHDVRWGFHHKGSIIHTCPMPWCMIQDAAVVLGSVADPTLMWRVWWDGDEQGCIVVAANEKDAFRIGMDVFEDCGQKPAFLSAAELTLPDGGFVLGSGLVAESHPVSRRSRSSIKR